GRIDRHGGGDGDRTAARKRKRLGVAPPASAPWARTGRTASIVVRGASARRYSGFPGGAKASAPGRPAGRARGSDEEPPALSPRCPAAAGTLSDHRAPRRAGLGGARDGRGVAPARGQ